MSNLCNLQTVISLHLSLSAAVHMHTHRGNGGWGEERHIAVLMLVLLHLISEEYHLSFIYLFTLFFWLPSMKQSPLGAFKFVFSFSVSLFGGSRAGLLAFYFISYTTSWWGWVMGGVVVLFVLFRVGL